MALPRPPLSSGLQFPKIGDEEDQFDFSDPYGISSIDWSEGSEPPPQEEGVLGKVSSGLSTLLYPFSIPKHGVDYAARELAKSLGHETGAEDSTGQIIEESLLGKASSDAGFGEKLGRGLLTGAADLATDPLMYVGGLGILGKAGKAVGLGTKGLEYLSAVEKIAHPAFQAQMGLGVLHGVGEAVPEIYNRGLTGRAGSLLAEAGVSGAGLFGPRMLQKRAERLASEKAAEGARVQALNDMANAQLTAQDIQERMAQEGDFNEDFNNPPVPADRINALDSDVRDYRKRIDAERQRQALAPRVDQDYDYTPERANPPDPYTEGGFAALLEPPPPDPQNVGFDQLDGPLAEAPRPEIPAPRGEEVLLPPVSDLGDTSPPSPPRPSRIPGALDDLFEAEEYGRPTPGPREEGITERPFGDDTPPFYQEAPPLSYLQQDLKTKLAELERLKTTYGPHSLEYQEARANLMRQQVDLQKQVEAADQAEAAIPREPEQLSLFDESGYQRPTAAPPPSTPRGQQMELPFGEPSMGPRERPPLSPGGEQLPLPFDQGGPEPPAGMESNADFESQRAAARARAARMGLPEPEESGYAPPEEPGYAPIPEKPSLTRPVEQPAETPPPGMSRLSEIARQVNAGRPGPRDLPPPPVLDPDFIAEPPPLVTDRDYPTVETERIPRPTRPVVSEGPFGLRREAPPQQKGLFPREPPPVETTEDRISKLNAQIASLPVGHPDEVPLIAERTRLSSEVPEAPPLPKRRSGLLSGDTRLKPIQGEIPLDVAGNRILPGQENWAPEDRAAVHSRAIELAEEVVEAGRGGKDGTVLEALPWGPKAILAGLKRDKGNVIERTVHDRLLQAKIPTETAPRLVEKQLYDRAGERANSLRREIQDAAKDGKWYFYDKEGNLIELPELQELERKGRVPKGATQAWEDWWSESGRAKADADPSKESNWGAKLGITYKGRTVTGGEILEGNPSIRKQMMRAALEIERGEGVDRSRGATLAENLTRRLPTDEDTSFTPSEYEANADLGGSPRPRRSYPGYGWKLHLATDNPEAVSAILKKLGLQHKIGQSDQVGKDLTVYIGSKDDAIAAAKAISKDAGRLLKESHGETLRDDIPLAPKVAGRFDAERGRGFNQYGAKGFPLLNEDVQARVWDKENFDQGAAEARAKKALIDEHGEYFTGTEAPPTPWWRDRVSDPESAADLGVLRSRSPEGEVARRGRENETYGDMTTRTRKAYKEAERLASGVHLVDVDGDLANNPSTSFVKSEEFQPLLRAIKTASERLGKAVGSRGRFFGVNLSTDLQGLILDGEITVNPMALIARARAIAARNLREMTRRGITLTKEELDRSFRTMFFDIAGKKIFHTLAHEHAHTIEGTKTPTGVSHTIAHKRAMQDAARGVKDSYHELTAAIKNAMTTIAPDLYATKKMDSGSPADLYKKFKFDKDEARKVALEGRANAGANRGSRNNEGLPGGQFGPEPPAQRGGGPTGGDLASGRGVGNTGRPEGTLRRGGERGEGLLGGGRGGARSTAPGLGGSDSTARGAEAGRGLAQQADLAKGEANQPAPIFYSEAERQAAKIPQAMRGEDVIRFLHGRGVKVEEMKWTGLDDFLRGKTKVTPKEVQDFIAQNTVVVEEVVKGKVDLKKAKQLAKASKEATARGDYAEALRLEKEQNAILSPTTKFGQYQLPGGEDYRELLLTQPSKKGGQADIEARADAAVRAAGKNPETISAPEYAHFLNAAERVVRASGESREFRGGHYDEPNVLAHVRFNERTDAQGKRVLFLEEIQSDWAQKGRREGFAKPELTDKQKAARTEEMSRLADARDAHRFGTPEHAAAQHALDAYLDESRANPGAAARRLGPPEGPFVGKTEAWSELAMKRMIRWAADNGFDKVAWTTGEQQAERYDLSKQIDKLDWEKTGPDTIAIDAFKDGKAVITKGVTAKELPDAVGKELAERILNDQAEAGSLAGLDLQVGGEGMKGFYDKILPTVAGKLGKKFGARVGETEIDPRPRLFADSPEKASYGQQDLEGKNYYGPESYKVHSLDITPQMKNSMPMFERDRPTSSTEGPAYSPLESNEGPALTPDEKAMLRKRGVEPPDIPERPEGETPPEQRVRTKPAQDALRNTVGPKVEQNVEKLRLAEMRGGLSPAKLDRETVKTIASMDKKALQTLLSKDGDYYLNRAARGQISVPDTIAWEARLRTLEEDAHERWTKFKEAEAIGTDPTEIKRLRQDFDIANESHWEERAAKINLGSLKGSALQAESVHSPSSPSSPSAFLSKIIRELDLTPKQAAGLNEIYLEDPLLLGDAIRTIRNPSLFRKLLEGQKGGMVAAISTNVANASGNIGEFAAKLGETYTSAVAENVISKSKIRRPVQEVKAELGGALRYTKPALRRLGQAIKEIALLAPEKVDLTHSLDYAGGMIGKGGRAVEALNKATGKNFHLGRAVRSPLRMLMAVDEFFKTVGGGAETAKLAYQAASRELGAKAGHSEVKALAKTIELEIGDLSTARGIDLARKVAQAKLERTFQESPIEIVQSFNVMRNKHPWLNLVVPFTTTPANILRRVWQRSPAGFVKVAKEYRAGKFNGDSAAFAEALARPILGTAIFGGFVAAAQSGLMTGSGPSDPDDLNLLKSTGWQPYSLVIENDNGTQSYIPFNRFEPISSLLSIAADWGTLSEVKQEEQGERVLGSLLSNMVSKTYLRGLSDAAMMISKPKEAGGQFLRSVAGTVVPNIVTKTGKAFDPTVYDTKPTKKGFASIPQGMANQIIADTPGLAGKYLQPRRDKFGKIIESPGGPIGRALSPFPITTSKPNAPLVKELIRVGVSLPSPKNTLRADGVEVSLNPRELELIQSGQQELESALTKLTKTPAYKYLADTREEAGSKSKEAYIRRAIDSIQRRTRDKIMKNSDFHRRFLSSRRKALSTREAL